MFVVLSLRSYPIWLGMCLVGVVVSANCTVDSGWVRAGMSDGRVRFKVPEAFVLGLGYRSGWRKAILT